MTKRYLSFIIYHLSFSAALLSFSIAIMLSACSDADSVISDSPTSTGEKTPIHLTAGIVDGDPRASISGAQTRTTVSNDNPYGKVALAFETGTSLHMVMKSVDKNDENPKYTRTIGFGQIKLEGEYHVGDDYYRTDVYFADAFTRYYEDSHSRDSKLSVFAVCVPGYYLPASVHTTPAVTADGISERTGLSENENARWTIGGSTEYSNTWSPDAGATTINWPINNTYRTKLVTPGADDPATNLTATDYVHQTANFINTQDLCFSNNVSKLGATDNRITYDNTEGVKKFISKHMIFHHAITWITFKIEKDATSFTGSDPFAFTNATDNENVNFEGFNTAGTFDIQKGEFTTITTTPIKKMHISDTNVTEDSGTPEERTYSYILDAYMVPGTKLNGDDQTSTSRIHFVIDGNQYHITKGQLYSAVYGQTLENGTPALNDGCLRPGVHYVFKMKLSKSKMEHLTAAVVPWEDVTAEVSPTNARITLSLLDNGTKQKGGAVTVTPASPTFDLYRKADIKEAPIEDGWASYAWESGYNTDRKATLKETAAGVYSAYNTAGTTPWYWPNNLTYYHLRALQPTGKTIQEDINNNGTPEDTSDDINNGDFITLTTAATYTDVTWGAPMNNIDLVGITDPEAEGYPKPAERLTYDPATHGFDGTNAPTTHQISKAIGPTTETINLELFHMMSDVTINLKSSGEDDNINLNGATISLSNIYPTAKVRVGNGLVVPDGEAGDVNPSLVYTTATNTSQVANYGFVPQDLTDVVLTITTADKNQYKVNMKDVVAKTYAPNLINVHTVDSPITRWYPNHTYTYTFNLTKKGISALSATVAEWEPVTATQDVQIQ